MDPAKIALKVFYEARGFYGYAKQPGKPSVESKLLEALGKTGGSPETLRAASRTDRGVWALGNVVSFEANGFSLGELNQALGGGEIVAWALARVPKDFSPRSSAKKHYRYVFEKAFENAKTVAKAAELFEGTHGFENFRRRDKARDKNYGSKIFSSKVSNKETGVLDIVGGSFGWEQVRRMASALSMLDSGELSLQEFSDLLDPAIISHVPPLGAGGLVLVDVSYPEVVFEVDEYWRRRVFDNLVSEKKEKRHAFLVSEKTLEVFSGA